eukprot:jgi/Psemu1/14601/gm1.14601_g
MTDHYAQPIQHPNTSLSPSSTELQSNGVPPKQPKIPHKTLPSAQRWKLGIDLLGLGSLRTSLVMNLGFCDGYDSRGDQDREESEQSFHFGPNTAATTAAAEEDLSLDEEDLSLAEEEEEEEEEEANDKKNLQKKSVVWLQQKLKLRRRPTSSNKAAFNLIPRRKQMHPGPGTVVGQQQQQHAALIMSCNYSLIQWRELHPEAMVVPEPANPMFRIARAPTISEAEGRLALIPKKYNFAEVCDILEFKGMKTEYEFDRRRSICKDADGKPVTKSTPQKTGSVDPKLLRKYNLSALSHLWEFLWTNWKASIAGAGDKCYKDFKPFGTKKLFQFFGLYVLHSLCPTARVDYKLSFTTRDKDDFLACQDLQIPNPPQKQYPTWKIQLLLKWMNMQCAWAQMLGQNIAVDESAMQFKGCDIDKWCMTYKRKGDGFEADTLCDKGYCYQIYMRNDPDPEKYLDTGLSPLHTRTMWLFDSLKDEYHHVGMDNLYNLVMFSKAAFWHSKRVLCHGVVACKANRGIPDGREAQGTVKAAILEGNPECAFLIASSVYNTKPVRYLSMMISVIEWVEKEEVAYNVDTYQKEKMKFLRLDQLDTCNRSMEGVDIADQLRGLQLLLLFFAFGLNQLNSQFQKEINMWNCKWWWSILFWAIEVLLTNAYTLYLAVCKEAGVKKPWYSVGYDFRRAVGEYWVSPDAVDTEAEARMFFIASTPGSASGVSPLSSQPTSCGSTSGEDGSFKSCRLNRCLDHFPFQTKRRTKCAMHGWLGLRKEGDLMRYAICNYCFKFTTPCYLCGTDVGFCCSLWCFLDGGNDDDDKYCFKFTTPCYLCGADVGFCCSLWCFLDGGNDDDDKYCFKFTTLCYLCGTDVRFCCSLWCFLGGGDNDKQNSNNCETRWIRCMKIARFLPKLAKKTQLSHHKNSDDDCLIRYQKSPKIVNKVICKFTYDLNSMKGYTS